jgi:hypothetical protein
MPRFFLLLLAFLIPLGDAQSQTTADEARFSFKEIVYDFGAVPPDTTLTGRFEFVNDGTALLVINDIALSCPCFETDWVRGPVMPGEKGWVSVRYPTSHKTGPFDKLLWIASNAANNTPNLDRFELRIKGLVVLPLIAEPKYDSASGTKHRPKRTSFGVWGR